MKEEIRVFKERAEGAFELSNKSFGDKNYDWSIFLLEQGCQLLIKYILALKIGYFSKTHSLSRLFEEANEISKDFSKFYDKYREKIAILEDAYINSRYLGKTYKKEDVKDLFLVFEKLLEVIKKHESS